MTPKQLKQHHQDDLEIRVIGHADSRYYVIQVVRGDDMDLLTSERGQPVVYRNLDEVYHELRRQQVNKAWLVHHVANDEMIGRDPYYQNPPASRIALHF